MKCVHYFIFIIYGSIGHFFWMKFRVGIRIIMLRKFLIRTRIPYSNRDFHIVEIKKEFRIRTRSLFPYSNTDYQNKNINKIKKENVTLLHFRSLQIKLNYKD